MRQQRYDAILSTAHPPSVHLAGWVLAARSGLPWIADYRDVWTGNLYSNRPKASRFLEGLLERFIIKRASRITTKSATDARLLSAVHGRHADAIENAFDPGDWTEIPQAQPQSFDLCFTGTLYDGKRSPDMLFRALRILCDRNRPAGLQARVHFYGRSCEFVGGMAREFGLEDSVVQHGLVERRQAMIAQRSSAALLIFLNMDPATNYELGSKYLEYLGARRPILAFGDPGSDLRRIIVEQKLGWFVSTVDEAIAAISQSYEQYVSGRYAIDPPLDAFPTADKLARAFAAVLDETLQHAGTLAARWDAKTEVMPRA
jgi:glycosyltransferase involved in cell wall biosynthesis